MMVVYDRLSMANRLGDDEAIHKMVLDIFLQDLPDQIDALRAALTTGEADPVRRAAHAIKGAAANVSAEDLRTVAAAMEEAARENRIGEVEAALDTLLEQQAALVAELTTLGLATVG
jgi:two-component system sensor histidine kinase/response regulator